VGGEKDEQSRSESPEQQNKSETAVALMGLMNQVFGSF